MPAFETQALDAGLGAALLEPGAVSSGALDHVTTYTLPGDPYAHLRTQGGARARQMITPEEVAAGIADAAEAPQLPLRIPLDRTACEVLAVRRAAPTAARSSLANSPPYPRQMPIDVIKDGG